MTREQKKTYTELPLDDDTKEWLKQYESEVVSVYSAQFAKASDRFIDEQKLINRFKEAIALVLRDGRSQFHAVEEAHNEICVAAAILANKGQRFVKLEYEPVLPGTARTIDFRATGEGRQIFYVDVKTIMPKPTDRWEQFEQAIKKGWLPDNVRLGLSKEWLGGEIWHEMFAARARMLEYAMELEDKIAAAELEDEPPIFILVLCGNGARWHEDELEDFVAYYEKGSHIEGDTFSKAEQHHMSEKGLTLRRTISRFASMFRPMGDTNYKRLNWKVQPPGFPYI